MTTIDGPDCTECDHLSVRHHLGIDGRYACDLCPCPNYVGEIEGCDEAIECPDCGDEPFNRADYADHRRLWHGARIDGSKGDE